MKVMRKMEVLVNGESGGFKVGDQIHVGKHYTATCQEVEKDGAIFMFDQYLDELQVMNIQRANEDGYEASDLRKFLKNFATTSMFNEIREMMVPFKKTGDLLRIPTAEEMFGPEEAHKHYETLSHKQQWPLMKDRHNRIAFHGEGQEIEWGWLQNRYKDSSIRFADVYTCRLVGCSSSHYISCPKGVRVVFKLAVV